MTESISARICTCLRSDCRCSDDDLVIAGVSGGIDSVFLLTQLHKLHQPVIAAVFDHGLRPEAAEECAFVEAYSAKLGIRCLRGKGDVFQFAAEKGLGIEEAARELRYRFLFDMAADHDARAVATAHHANDQAETVLLHILRGSGIDGLGGIRPRSLPNAFSETIPLIRPLLGITRAEIEAFAAETSMPYRDDRSNEDNSFTRNRLRNDLIPKLSEDYNPQIIRALCRLADNAENDLEILSGLTRTALKDACIRLFDSRAEWERNGYTSQGAGLRLRMLRMILTSLFSGDPDAGYQNLKDADAFFMNSRTNQTIPFISGLLLKCEGDKMMILRETGQTDQQKYPQIWQDHELSAETRRITPDELPELEKAARSHPELAILDADRLVSAPFLRTIREGERFDPFGMDGRTQKLSDFLINAKVPKEYRSDLTAAADQSGIVWIPGLRVSDRCALNEQTKRIMILKLRKKQEGAWVYWTF